MSLFGDTPADLRLDREMVEQLRLGPPGRRRAEPRPPTLEEELSMSATYTKPPMFGDSAQADAYARDVRDARARQLVQFAAAPRCTVETPRGTRHQGEELLLSDLGGMNSARELVAIGVILELSQEELAARQPPTGERSRYRVAPGRRSLGGARGLTLLPDQPVCAADFERERTVVQPATATTPAVLAGESGEEILQRLVRGGLVIDLEAGEQQQRAAGSKRR